MISGPASEDGAEAFSEQSPENQAPTQSSSLGGLEEGENSLGDDKSNHGNEIITPTDDLLPHDPAEAQPTLDNVLVQHPVSVMNEPGETNELVEDTATGKPEGKLWFSCISLLFKTTINMHNSSAGQF